MVELDPDKREWEYDGDGKRIYKLEAGKPNKTPYTDLDGGVPMHKNWVNESNDATTKLNEENKDEREIARVLRFPRKGSR